VPTYVSPTGRLATLNNNVSRTYSVRTWENSLFLRARGRRRRGWIAVNWRGNDGCIGEASVHENVVRELAARAAPNSSSWEE
jgi:hypothetical protein